MHYCLGEREREGGYDGPRVAAAQCSSLPTRDMLAALGISRPGRGRNPYINKLTAAVAAPVCVWL